MILEDSIGKKIKYKGKKYLVNKIDGYLTLIHNIKSVEDYTVSKGFYYPELEPVPCYIVSKGKFYVHAESIRKGVEDVIFKYKQDNLDLDELVSDIKERGSMTVEDYRILTGACRLGIEKFVEINKIKNKELPLKDIVRLTKGHFGYEQIKKYFK